MTTLDPLKQRDFALHVLKTLRASGFEAYWAGGCVRDELLRRRPKDYDVATSAVPAEVVRAFRTYKTLEIGAAFGVVAVIGPRKAGAVEVSTFRRDLAYRDGRRPEGVEFVSAELDAQRRDFTINGMFYDPIEERVIDYVGGQADLQAGIVRAIGDAQARFEEDKLRMLRAVRMAATFGFRLEDATLAAVRQMAPQVTVVSPERIAQELRQMLVLQQRGWAFELLRMSNLLAAVWPEASGPDETAWQLAHDTLEQLEGPTFPLAVAAVGNEAGCIAAAATKTLASRWRLSVKEREAIGWLTEHARALDDAPTAPWSRVQRLLVHPGSRELVELHAARAKARGASMSAVEYCRARLAWPAERLNPPPLVTGNDLIQQGVKPGPGFAELLERVRDAQLEGRIATKDEALALVGEMMGEMMNDE